MIFNDRRHVEDIGRGGAKYFEEDNYFKCKTLNKFWIFVDKEDHGYSPHAKSDGFWEAWITYWMSKNVSPTDFVLDIGANHGYYSLMLASNGCEVWASEPQEKLAKLISMSAKENKMKNLSVIKKAFSDSIGVSKFQVPIHHGMNATLANKNSYAPFGSEELEVETTTLDSFDIKFDFIKIDAEGAEEKIWNGAQEYLKRNPDVLILMEWRYDRYENPELFLKDIFDKCNVTWVCFDGEEDAAIFDNIISKKNEDWMLVLRMKDA